MIIVIWLLNFVISWFNAWGCGKTWTESKHVGGWPHLLNWSGAVMSAAGFTWCYLVILGAIGTQVPIKGDDGTVHVAVRRECGGLRRSRIPDGHRPRRW